MLRTFIFTSVVALVFAASSGTLNLGTTQSNNAGNFFMSWALCNSSNVYYIYVTLQHPFQGYAGIIPKTATSTGGAHDNKDIISVWVDSDGPQAADMFAKVNCTGRGSYDYGRCNFEDTDLGGTNDVSCVSGWQNATGTSVTFKRKFATTDPFDTPFRTGQMSIMWAFEEVAIYGVSSINDFTFLHCFDCAKPIYNDTCGDAIRLGIRSCPASGQTGSFKRDSDYLVTFWDGTGTLPSCSTFPQTSCIPSTTGVPSISTGEITTGIQQVTTGRPVTTGRVTTGGQAPVTTGAQGQQVTTGVQGQQTTTGTNCQVLCVHGTCAVDVCNCNAGWSGDACNVQGTSSSVEVTTTGDDESQESEAYLIQPLIIATALCTLFM